jgi:hypothetical protein
MDNFVYKTTKPAVTLTFLQPYPVVSADALLEIGTVAI